MDKVRIQVEGGRGGKGVVSFETSTTGDGWSKKPAGGTGGRGGDVIIRASASQQDLHMQTFVIRGRPGGDASGSKGSMGRDGKIKTIVVPVGTIVREVHRRYVVNGADIDQDGGEDELLAYGSAARNNINKVTDDDDTNEDSLLPLESPAVNVDERGRGRKRRGGRERERGGETTNTTLLHEHQKNSSSSLSSSSSSIVSIPPPLDIDKLRSMRELIPGGDGGGRGQHLSSSSSTTTTIDRSSTGTELVRTNKSGLVFKEKTDFLVDLDSPGQSILVAEGGAAGVGNKGSLLTYSEQRQDELRPHITGGKGVVRFLELELKIIADVGLVGFPNAGKSSFLASVSKVSCCCFLYIHGHDYIDVMERYFFKNLKNSPATSSSPTTIIHSSLLSLCVRRMKTTGHSRPTRRGWSKNRQWACLRLESL